MKKPLLSFAVFFVCFLAGINAFAQNYQPFRKGLTYHYIARDSIYSMRIDTAKVVNGDSVFVFNPITKKGTTPMTFPACGTNVFTPEYYVQSNNQFGQQMQKKANGDYIFKTHQGPEFLLKTKVATGQSWGAFANPAITATLTSRTFEPVKNAVSDSVLTYTLSNGKTIKLSKNYGFLKAPNFSQYSDNYFKPRDLEFYSLPEKGLGHTISSPFAIYDFQPGDKFGLYYKHITVYNSVCKEQWINREVKARTNSPNGTTVSYTIEEQQLTKGYGTPGSPMGWCSAPKVTTLSPVGTYTLVITRDYPKATNALSQGFIPGALWSPGDSPVSTHIFSKAQYNYREQMHFLNLQYDSCSKTFDYGIDYGIQNTYGVGLGETKREIFSMGASETTILECYTKGSETYGNCRTFSQIMATEDDLNTKPLVRTFPNPFTSELTITFGETSGKAQVTLHNTLGQIVWQQETAVSANSEIKLMLPELPKGLYVLQASQNGKTYTSRLVKQ